MKRHELIYILFLCTIPTYAQFNDTTNYYFNAASTGIINKTNEGRSYVLNNMLKFNIYRKAVSVNTNNSWIYGEQQGILTNNDFLSSVDFSLYKTLRDFYYWGLASYEKNFSLKINNRLQTGLGVGYNVVDRNNIIIVLSNGILYEKNNLYNLETVEDPDYEILRNSFRLKFRIVLNEGIILDGTDFLQHSLADRNDYIIRSNTNLSVRLWKLISVTASLTWNKLNKTQRENLLCNFGLKAERYF